MKGYRAGIDIGSTTVKLVVLDGQDNIIFGDYRRHLANTQETLAQLLGELKNLPHCRKEKHGTGKGSRTRAPGRNPLGRKSG